MSKSLGNFFTVRDLLEQDVPGEVIRFVMLSTHYRKPMDWTEKKREEAEKTLKRWWEAIAALKYDDQPTIPSSFLKTVSNDLNTPGAISEMHQLYSAGRHQELALCAEYLGIDEQVTGLVTAAIGFGTSDKEQELANEVARKWMDLRESGDYAVADMLKSAAEANGVVLSVVKQGNAQSGTATVSTKFNIAKIRELAQ
jgi:cysteinyl-tRNA synthetase